VPTKITRPRVAGAAEVPDSCTEDVLTDFSRSVVQGLPLRSERWE
jgi:hypothetical protein